MTEPIQRRGAWWQESVDGGWLRWNEKEEGWEKQITPPPPPRGEAPDDSRPHHSSSITVLPKPAAILLNGEVPAEWWQRVLASLIDLGVILGGFTFGALLTWSTSSMAAGMEDDFLLRIMTVTFGIVSYLLGPVYLIHHHAVHGQTVGKAVMQIFVCDEQTGDAIGYGRAFLRWFLPVLMTAALYVPGLLNLLWPLWDSKKQALHDKAVRSAVVIGNPNRGRLFEVLRKSGTLWVSRKSDPYGRFT